MSLPIELPVLNIQLRMAAPYDVVLTTGMPAGEMTAETVGHVMDMLTEVAEREKLKGELAALRALLRRNREMLSTGTFDKQVDELRRQRASLDANISEKWVNSSRRGDLKLSGAQKTQMEEFDKQIGQALKAKQDVENGIPLTLWQIDCLYARIAGEAEPPMPEEVAALMGQIEMPEDVGFTPSFAA